MYLSEQIWVPAGGVLDCSSGGVTGGCRGQNFGGHSGLRSVTLAHSGRFNPLTQMQVHSAWLLFTVKTDSAVTRNTRQYRIGDFRLSRTGINRLAGKKSIFYAPTEICSAGIRKFADGVAGLWRQVSVPRPEYFDIMPAGFATHGIEL